MAPIATYVFIDIDSYPTRPKFVVVTMKALRREDLRTKKKDEEDTLKTTGKERSVSNLVMDFIKPLDKPVCLVYYDRRSWTFELLERSFGRQFGKKSSVEHADAMAACYDILEPNNEKTTEIERLTGALPWQEKYSLLDVYNRVVGDGRGLEICWGQKKVVAMILIARKLSNKFVEWIDQNHSFFRPCMMPLESPIEHLNQYTGAERLQQSDADGKDSPGERPSDIFTGVAACREDGLAVDEALESLITKKLSKLILEEINSVPKGPQFYESKLVDGYLQITPMTTASREWLLSQDFGVLNGHRIVLRLTSRVCVWIPGAPDDIPEDALVLQYIRGQNWDKPELELEKWLLSNRLELPMGTYFNFSVPSTVESVWGEDAQRQLFFSGNTVRAVITRS